MSHIPGESGESSPIGRRPDVAGVPRRFGIVEIMLFSVPFAMLFAALRAMRVQAGLVMHIVVFCMVIAAAQALLFGGRKPRGASVAAGMLLFPMQAFIGPIISGVISQGTSLQTAIDHSLTGGTEPSGSIVSHFGSLLEAATTLAFAGGMFGYLAGMLVASVFVFIPRREQLPRGRCPKSIDQSQ